MKKTKQKEEMVKKPVFGCKKNQNSLNNVILIGHIGQEPVKDGEKTTISIATNYAYLKDDEWISETEWNNVTLFGKKADYVLKNVEKGSLFQIEGRLNKNYVKVESIQVLNKLPKKEVN